MIELREITYTVEENNPQGKRTVLDNISLVIPESTLCCIMGASGSGKTTLLRLMAGLLKPDSGQILIDERDIAVMDEKELNTIRREMGFVFQYGALFDSLTIAENVGFALQQSRRPKAEIHKIVSELLAAVGLENTSDKLPTQLSGGMRKRAAMARALATSPRLVLYDEPTSGLDPIMARQIDNLIVNLRDYSHATSVVVSHDVPSILRIADQIFMLHQGKIVEQGNPEQMLESQVEIVQQFIGRENAESTFSLRETVV